MAAGYSFLCDRTRGLLCLRKARDKPTFSLLAGIDSAGRSIRTSTPGGMGVSPTLSSSFRGRLRRSTLVARPEGVRLHRFSQGSECGPVWCRGGSLISPPRRALSEHQLDRCCRHFILPSPISPSVESSPVLVPRYDTGNTPGFVTVPREQPRRSLPSTRD